MEGQKVVKVFCHEDACIQDFKGLNGKLRDSANNANRYASILMPVLGNLGYVSYAVIAMAGACLSIFGGQMTLGTRASFLQFSRSFNQPISQLSQQLNSIIMAAAGAERIFGLLDEEAEQDNGYVKLVNAKYDAQGNLTEVSDRTGIWAWKHYHKADNTTTYQLMEGDVVFDHVDFGYTEEKEVLHDIEIYARPGQKVAFVGATGAGKTTVTNLINRFYDVQDGMDRLMKGRTVFVIAHRLSTIRNSDVIMVLDHGRIVERGNHESLLAKKGMYYQLYTNLGH